MPKKLTSTIFLLFCNNKYEDCFILLGVYISKKKTLIICQRRLFFPYSLGSPFSFFFKTLNSFRHATESISFFCEVSLLCCARRRHCHSPLERILSKYWIIVNHSSWKWTENIFHDNNSFRIGFTKHTSKIG